jgi:hypothetical protein
MHRDAAILRRSRGEIVETDLMKSASLAVAALPTIELNLSIVPHASIADGLARAPCE